MNFVYEESVVNGSTLQGVIHTLLTLYFALSSKRGIPLTRGSCLQLPRVEQTPCQHYYQRG